MAPSTGSFFVVKRKADEEEVYGGKRLRLLGSYTSKPNEEDIVSHVGLKALGKKRVVIQDFDTNEFKQFISELPEKKTKTDEESELEIYHDKQTQQRQQNNDFDSENRHSITPKTITLDTSPSRVLSSPRFGLNLNAAESVSNAPKKASRVDTTSNCELSQWNDDYDDNTGNSGVIPAECYVYDVYGIDEDCNLDFGSISDPDDYHYDDDSDENNENWRGNDYPDENSDDCHSSLSSQTSDSHEEYVCQNMELYDFELDEFRKFTLHDTDDEFGNGSSSNSDY